MQCTRRKRYLSTLLLLACAGCGEEGKAAQQPGVQPAMDGAVIGAVVAVDSDSASAAGPEGGGPLVPTSTDAASAAPRDAGGVSVQAEPRDAGATMGEAGSGAIDAGNGPAVSQLAKFSFFVTSLSAMRSLAKSPDGFGGDLRFGEQGEGAGLRGADKICTAIAETSMPGSGAKQWRAFLSTTTVNARTRVGSGPWYDRMGRLIAQNLTQLLGDRPGGAEPLIRDDLPNELGAPNHEGSAENGNDDNHDVITATNLSGDYDGSNNCADWTSTTAVPAGGGGGDLGGLLDFGMNGPGVGHSWPAFSGTSWMATHRAPGCSPSVNLVQTGPGSGTGIGNGGGYGGIYCFALAP